MFVARFALIFVAASAAIFTAGGQETVSVSSSISRVIVYLDRALVTRAANASLPAGSSIIEFAGLPATLDEGSVAVSGKSDGTLTIEGIDIRQQFLAESANPKAQELKRQIHGLQDQKKSLAGQKNVLEEKREFFKNLSSGLGKGAINLDDISKLYTFCGQELSNLAENALSIGQSDAKLNLEIDRLQRELDALRGATQGSANRPNFQVFKNKAAKAPSKWS